MNKPKKNGRGFGMTGKRFEVHHMIRDYSTTEDVDFDFLQKLINEHRQPKDLTMHITDCGKDMTYRECEYLLNKYYEEKKELKVQCNLLREQANEFHRGARENANRAGQLEKENKELKSDNKKMAKFIMSKGYTKDYWDWLKDGVWK